MTTKDCLITRKCHFVCMSSAVFRRPPKVSKRVSHPVPQDIVAFFGGEGVVKIPSFVAVTRIENLDGKKDRFHSRVECIA